MALKLSYGPPIPLTGPCNPAGTAEIGAGMPRPVRIILVRLDI